MRKRYCKLPIFKSIVNPFFRMLQTTLMTNRETSKKSFAFKFSVWTDPYACDRSLRHLLYTTEQVTTTPIFCTKKTRIQIRKYTMTSGWIKLNLLPCCCIPRRNFQEPIWTFCPALYSSSCCTQSMVLRICRFPSFSPEEGLRNQRPEPQTFFWVAPLYRWPLKQECST